jgi:hypothetical protein
MLRWPLPPHLLLLLL